MRYIIVCVLILSFGCKEENKASNTNDANVEMAEETSDAIQLDIYDYDGLKPLINKKDDKVHVVNFWATWCAPCIKELPYFEDINKKYSDKNIEVLLVNLDFPRQYDTKLKPFLQEKQLTSKVVCFDDVDQNRWIPDIDTTWSGALPATIIYNQNKRQFYEGSFTFDELETEVKKFLN